MLQQRSIPRLFLFALAALMVAFSGLILAPALDAPANAQDVSLEDIYNEVYDQVSPSVVSISVRDTETQRAGGGSGFVVDTQGHIVTNYHVVADSDEIVVRFIDNTQVRATIIGLDPDSDLAVLRVNVAPDKLVPVTFGDSDALEVGEIVMAIGSPFGQRWTLTSGIISALDRSIRGLDQFSIGGVIQTDAAINPGNSGGPLLNAEGEVIGVNSQIVSRSGASAGIGFAVPSNLTQRVMNTLIEQGFVNYSYLGIEAFPNDVTLDLIEALNLPNDFTGVPVVTAVPGGPAARAGLRSADINQNTGEVNRIDIITAIDGQPISGFNDLISYLARNTQPGDTVTLDVRRNGETVSINVRLTPRP